MIRGMMKKFPEIASLIEKINVLDHDRVFYRDNIFFLLMANTCNDGEILGVLNRMSYLANSEIDKTQKGFK